MLRQYQRDALRAFYDSYKADEQSGVIEAPTGSGKSLIIAHILSKLTEPHLDKRILVLCHQAEILNQNLLASSDSLNKNVYCASLGLKNDFGQVVFASRDSYGRKKSYDRFDLIIIDEAHLVSPEENTTYQKIINAVKPHYVLGLTATPYRLDNGAIYGSIFKKLIYSIKLQQLIDEKFLVPFVWPERVKLVASEQIKKTAGDFNMEAQAQLYTSEVVDKAIDVWSRVASDRKLSVFFCCSIAHAQLVQSKIKGSVLITGETDNETRKNIFLAARNGHIKSLINVGVLTTGVDIPRIDCVVFMRATTSASLFVQCLGRALRLFEGKTNALILDFAGNYERFGHPDEPFIKGRKKKNEEKTIETMLVDLLGDHEVKLDAAHKKCPSCKKILAVATKVCPECNHLFISHQGTFYDGDWIEIKSFTVAEKKTKRGLPCKLVTYYSHNETYIEWLLEEFIWQKKKTYQRLAQLKLGVDGIRGTKNKNGYFQVKAVRVKPQLLKQL